MSMLDFGNSVIFSGLLPSCCLVWMLRNELFNIAPTMTGIEDTSNSNSYFILSRGKRLLLLQTYEKKIAEFLFLQDL